MASDKFVQPVEAIVVVRRRSAAFNPSQARDERGRWTNIGGGTISSQQNAQGQVVEPDGRWNRSSDGELPYGWPQDRTTGDAYTVPVTTHTIVRDRGVWGSSHGNSQMLTGGAAALMGIEGYNNRGELSAEGKNIVDRFLRAIGEDQDGAEEVLHHSFENVRGTSFKVGDTLRLPLTATAGDIGHYGVRLDAEDQEGMPIVFEFAKGTQMAAYSGIQKKDLEDLGAPTIEAAIKERGYVWDEAIVAGGFRVTGVETKYMGSQHSRGNPGTVQVFGKVIKLQQTESFHPTKGWSQRG